MALTTHRRDDLTTRLAAVPDTLKPDDDGGDRRGHWLLWVLVVLVALALTGVGYLALGGNAAKDQTAATAAQAVAAADPVLELCAGKDDVARALAAKGACGAAAQVRAEPIPGANGTNGADGKPGRDGIDGRDGKDGVTPACVTQPGQCQGVDGTDGKDGKDAVNGTDGKDGKDGKDGNDGAAGPPPGRFVFTDGTGRTQTCDRDPGSPDNDATYTCTTPDAPTEPTSMRLTSLP